VCVKDETHKSSSSSEKDLFSICGVYSTQGHVTVLMMASVLMTTRVMVSVLMSTCVMVIAKSVEKMQDETCKREGQVDRKKRPPGWFFICYVPS